MKIILTFLSSEGFEKDKGMFDPNRNYPLGLAYIKAYLESKENAVKYVDCTLKQFEESKHILTSEINNFKPDIIGFSILTGNHLNTYKMLELIHNNHPNVKIVVGGIHTTILYEQILNKYPYVIAVLGEGEITFGEIAENRPLESINGIAYSDSTKVIKTENRELCNLDELPIPEHIIDKDRTQANIISSRGCPFSCSFCALNPNSKRTRRMRSIKSVVDEIEYIVKNNATIKSIYVMDDAFTENNKRTIELCKEIVRRGLNHIEYSCQARFKPFSGEIIPYLEEANFKYMNFGLETANEDMLKSCHKNIKQQDVINTMEMLKDSKIVTSMFLIVGLPGETKDTIIETANFVRKIQKIKYMMYYEYPGFLIVFPGTEIYNNMKAKGLIDDDYWLKNHKAPFYTAEHCIRELQELKTELINRISFMPFSITKLRYQSDMIVPIIKYSLKRYKSQPLSLIKAIIKQ